MARDWIWVGGRLCIDLINTLRYRKTGPRECLLEPADLAEWLALAGLAPATVDITPEHVSGARQLREAVDRLVLTKDPRTRAIDMEVLNRFVWAGHASAQLVSDQRGGFEVRHDPGVHPAAVALGVIATDAMDLLASNSRDRVRECAANGCGLRFQDRSPAANRQWCSMRRCGNREKAKQHYRRRAARSE